MSRHVLSGALVLAVCLSSVARADNAEDKAAELRAAISACDKGASVPLDPEAKAPVVHFGEFILRGQTLDKASLDEARGLVAQCKLAADGAPDQKRLKLEWLYRLVLEPGRLWKRYMVFTPLLIAHTLAERAGLL